MTRVLLPFDDWPETDRLAWQEILRAGDLLDVQGTATHWRPATRIGNQQHYSRWLGYIAGNSDLDPITSPADRVTPERVRSYVAHLEVKVAPRTMVSALVGLKVTIIAMTPEQSWRWLADVCNALNRRSEPITDKRARMRDTREVVAAAVARMAELKAGPLRTRYDRVAFRDSLMLALMAARPLRLKNFSGLVIGQHMIQQSDGWRIDIPAEETKTNQAIDFDVPVFLLPYLAVYLERIRPSFLSKAHETPPELWLGFEGRPLTYHSIYLRIIFITERLFGHSINPHLLRDCAATTLSTCSTDDALTAAALLGHRSFNTTERYYIRANQLEACRQINTLIETVQQDGKERS